MNFHLSLDGGVLTKRRHLPRERLAKGVLELCDTQRCQEIGYFCAGWLASDGWALLYSLPGHALFSNDNRV